MSEPIEESGMIFIADNTFHIEESQLYKDVRGYGVKTVEFIRVKSNDKSSELLFVEAKPTFANPTNPSPDNLRKFRKSIKDICAKFVFSLCLFSAINAGVTEYDFPDDFILLNKVSIKLYLVIRNYELGWCKKLKIALDHGLPTYLKKMWKPEVLVINEKTAIEQGIAVCRQVS